MNLPATIESLSPAKRTLLDAVGALLLLGLLWTAAFWLMDTPWFDWLAKLILVPLAWPLLLFGYLFPDNSMNPSPYVRGALPLIALATFLFDFVACSFLIDKLLERYSRRVGVESVDCV